MSQPTSGSKPDAVVVGSGPNGLAAAIHLAQRGLSVLVIERANAPGGGLRSIEATLPGFVHDHCAAVHPLGIASPFFSQLPLAEYGLQWVQPEFALTHPLEGGAAAVLQGSTELTARSLGPDQSAYRELFEPLVARATEVLEELLQPPIHFPRHLVTLLRFLANGARSARGLALSRFAGEPARALFAGLAAHSFLPLDQSPSASVALALGMTAHGRGWPVARGGSGQIAKALVSYLCRLGGEIRLGCSLERIEDVPPCRLAFFDLTPQQFLRIAGHRLPSGYRAKLERYRYGPGVFKLDYALNSPIPWQAPECSRAGTVHVGGTLEEVARSEREAAEGREPQRPFVLVAQPTLFDVTRAPAGRHIAWAYCHVPNGSSVNMTARIEAQIERFAPGFRDCILARHAANCADLERANPNLVGGDISAGAMNWRQIIARPVLSLAPYQTPLPALYLCSASTPPGGGAHGMCGYHAAEVALRSIGEANGQPSNERH